MSVKAHTMKQAVAALLAAVALAAAFAAGLQMRPAGQAASLPQVFGQVLARGSQREILIAAPAGETSAPVIVCNAGPDKNYSDCRKKYQAARAAGWDSEN